MAPAAVLATVGDNRGRTVAGQHDPRNTGTLRAAQQRAQVARVGDAGRHDKEGRRTGPARTAEILERDGFERAGQRHDALGRLGAGLCVETGAGHRLDRHPQAGRQLLDAIELWRGVLVLGEQDPAHRPSPDRATTRAPPGGPRPGRPPSSLRASGRGRPRRAAARLGTPARRAAWLERGRRRGTRRSAAHDGSIRTTARHAMPSARPSAPMPSARVALTEIGRADHGTEPFGHGRRVRRQARCVGDDRAVRVDAAVALRGRHPHDFASAGRDCRRPPRPGRCRESAVRGRRAPPRPGWRRPLRGRRRRRRCDRSARARPRSRRRRGRAAGGGRRRSGGCRCPGRSASLKPPRAASTRSARGRSSGAVILRLSVSPGTTTTSRPPLRPARRRLSPRRAGACRGRGARHRPGRPGGSARPPGSDDRAWRSLGVRANHRPPA